MLFRNQFMRGYYCEENPGDGGEGGAGSGGDAGDPGQEPGAGGGEPADPGAGGGGEPTPGYFQTVPDDWRSQIAGGDEKRLGQLERYSTLDDVFKAGFEAQDRIRKGEISNGLPDNPTDEQSAAWREANGVPAEVGGYELSLDEGLVLGEDDNRIMEGVYEAAHNAGVSTDTMSQITNAMLKGREAEYQATLAQDGMDQQTTDRMLKDTWGGDFETNVNMVKGLVSSQFPDSIREALESARLADGKALFNSPEVMVAFADMARKINPAATVVPGANNPTQAIDDEIKTLEGRMGDKEWFSDKDAQARYRSLIDARGRMNQ